MENYTKRIVIKPGVRSGKPCVKGTRITVFDVLGWLAAGMSEAEITRDFPQVTDDDIRACLAFAADWERRVPGSGGVKLLLDENLSFRTAKAARGSYPGTLHVSACALLGQSDEAIWRYARVEGFVIVSRDSDFVARSMRRGHPPKVIWIREDFGSWKNTGKVLVARMADLEAFGFDPDSSCFILE